MRPNAPPMPERRPARVWHRPSLPPTAGPTFRVFDPQLVDKKSLVLFFASLFAFRFALDYGYVNFVYQQYEFFYLAMRLNVTAFQYAMSLLLFSINLLNLRPIQHSPANIFQLMATIFVVAPLTSQFGLDADRPFEPVICTIAAFLFIRLITQFDIFKPRRPVTSTQGRYFALVIAVAGIMYLLAWSVISGAVNSFNLNPELVYDFRRTVSSLMDIGPLAYLNLWVINTFTIYLVCYSLEQKKYFLLLPLLAVQIYFAGINNHKGVVFMPILVIGFWYFLARTQKLFPLPLAVAAVIVVSVGIFQIWDYNWVAELALRRTFFVPSGATFAWFEYFSQQPYVYWSDSVLSMFVDTIYTSGPKIPYIIGEWLFPGNDLAANNGLVSAGYSHAGYFGIALYALILGLVLNLINYIARTGVELWMATALTLVPLRTAISDSDLFTAILSHGIMVSIIFLWLHRHANVSMKRQQLGTVTRMAPGFQFPHRRRHLR